MTPDPLDHSFPWHALSLLCALGVLPLDLDTPEGGWVGGWVGEGGWVGGQAGVCVCACVGGGEAGGRGAPPGPALSHTHARASPRLTPCLRAVAASHMGFVAQLEAVGGLAHWAIYAALHLPDSAARKQVGG